MSNYNKHIILGSGGAISKFLVNELKINNENIKLASRSGKSWENSPAVRTDLLNREETFAAVEESSIVYLLAGIKYKTSEWEVQWPKIMQNTIDACIAKGAKLIFFDNVYPYGKVEGVMSEETSLNPCSKKGEIRARLDEKILDEIKRKNLNAIIARAADFYGPYSENSSIPVILVFNNLLKGKSAYWLVNSRSKHSFTYTGDCGKALYLLAKTDSAFNQVWHMPTAKPALTGEEFISLAAKSLNVKPKFTILNKWMVKLLGIFNWQIKELYEMLYQNEFDYIFDSSKFEKEFKFKPTSYHDGILETADYLKGNTNK